MRPNRLAQAATLSGVKVYPKKCPGSRELGTQGDDKVWMAEIPNRTAHFAVK